MSARDRGDYEYTEDFCRDSSCHDVAVVDMGGMFEDLCILHLNDAYAMMEADRQVKWNKENPDGQ